MQTTIAILGAGNIGKAIGHFLGHRTDLSIVYWDKEIGKVEAQPELKDFIPAADFIFLCIPSFATRTALLELKPHLNKKTIIISVSKGIEWDKKTKKAKFMNEVMAEALKDSNAFALLSGPMLAREISEGLKAAGTLSTEKKSTYARVENLFRDSELILDFIADTHSVAMAGVLKNVYTLAFGIAGGLEWGNNLKGWLIVKALREMQTIVTGLKGKPEILLSFAGLGDLTATAFSPHSRNAQMGKAIVEGKEFDVKTSEGYISLLPLTELIGKSRLDKLPILSALTQIFLKKKNPRKIFDALLEQ